MTKTEIAFAVISLVGSAYLFKKYAELSREDRRLDEQFEQLSTIVNS